MTEQQDSNAPVDEEGLATLVEYLHRTRGFDFTGYKESTLGRRIQRRMQLVNVPTYASYVDYLEVHPDEFPQLFNTVLINVTGFFRDPAAWEALSARLRELLATRSTDRPVRVWSAGCASGEEAFTLAMLLAEELGPAAYAKRVKIYATDIDEDALLQARQGTYTAKGVEGVPPAMLEKYFVPAGSAFTFSKDLRRAVIFGRHDLAQDAPISRIDVLTCRNTLMYFNAEVQTRMLNRLHFALADDGILLVGKAEMLLTHGNLFSPIDLKLRLFTRARGGPKPRERDPVDPVATPAATDGNGSSTDGESATKSDRIRLQQATFDAAPNPVVVLDAHGVVALVNQHAQRAFGLLAADIGRPFQDLELSYRPVELRSSIDLARTEKIPKHLREVERTVANETCFYDITVTPLFGERHEVVGTQIGFVDVTRHRLLQSELRRTNAELETAHEELQSTSEELETTNEELQSTVEELETTNEELQSTNEELETMNEELQSTNEELQTINEELRQRSDELNDVNSFFGAILRSLQAGVAVLDQNLSVKAWNQKMEDLWGLRADEVEGKSFNNLDIGLPVTDLAGPIRACLQGDGDVQKRVDCINRRGKNVTCKVVISRLAEAESRGVIILVEEQS